MSGGPDLHDKNGDTRSKVATAKLLRAGACTNLANNQGLIPLHLSASFNQNVVGLLLDFVKTAVEN
jgi:ankyrin repeat protein